MDWSASAVNDGSLDEKKKDGARGIANVNGVYSHSKYFEWKRMAFNSVPRLPTVKDKFFTEKAPEHSLTVSYTKAIFNPFEVGKHEYLPFPRDVKTVNPNIQDVLGWASLNQKDE